MKTVLNVQLSMQLFTFGYHFWKYMVLQKIKIFDFWHGSIYLVCAHCVNLSKLGMKYWILNIIWVMTFQADSVQISFLSVPVPVMEIKLCLFYWVVKNLGHLRPWRYLITTSTFAAYFFFKTNTLCNTILKLFGTNIS